MAGGSVVKGVNIPIPNLFVFCIKSTSSSLYVEQKVVKMVLFSAFQEEENVIRVSLTTNLDCEDTFMSKEVSCGFSFISTPPCFRFILPTEVYHRMTGDFVI